MKIMTMTALRDEIAAKKAELGWLDDEATAESLRNKGNSRTQRKRDLLARAEARAKAAGEKPVRAYY